MTIKSPLSFWLILIAIVSIFVGFYTPIQAQSVIPLMPSPLIITVTDSNNSHEWLAYVNPDDGSIHEFYRDDNIAILRGIQWSPDGQMLAFFRRLQDTSTTLEDDQLCLLNQYGVFVRCFDAKPYINETQPFPGEFGFFWSSDSRFVYFDSIGNRSGKVILNRRYVEVSAATGQVTRTLFDTPNTNSITVATHDLRYLVVTDIGYPSSRDPVLIDLTTAQPIASFVRSSNDIYTCIPLSPSGHYFVDHDVLGTTIQKLIVRRIPTGETVSEYTFTVNYGQDYGLCPVWQADESGFFVLRSAFDSTPFWIEHYRLQSSQPDRIYTAPSIETGYMEYPTTLAPTGDALVSAVRSGLNSKIVVVYKGIPVIIEDPFFALDYPVWSPRLPNPLSITPICSYDPANYRSWRVQNNLPKATEFQYSLPNSGAGQSGFGYVPGALNSTPGEVFISVQPESDNTLRLSLNGAVQAELPGIDTICPTETRPTTKLLQLTSLCSPTPAEYRVWRVRNTTSNLITFSWDVYGTTQKGSGVARSNADTTFLSQTVANSPNTVRLFINGALQDTKASNSAQCP